MRGVPVRAHLLPPGGMRVAGCSHLSRMQTACDVSRAAVWSHPQELLDTVHAPTNTHATQEHDLSRLEEERSRAAEAAKREEDSQVI